MWQVEVGDEERLNRKTLEMVCDGGEGEEEEVVVVAEVVDAFTRW